MKQAFECDKPFPGEDLSPSELHCKAVRDVTHVLIS